MVIVLPWIPGHYHITGNETANAVTLKTLITQTTAKEISLGLVKTVPREFHNDERLAIRRKVNQSHYRPEVHRGFQEVKVPRFRDNGTGWW